MRGGLMVRRQEKTRIQQQQQNEQKLPPRRWESPVLTSLKPPVSEPSKEVERRSLSSSDDEVMESVEEDVSTRVTTEDQPQPGPMEAEKAVVGDGVPNDTDSQDIPCAQEPPREQETNPFHKKWVTQRWSAWQMC
ncbi:hypothetical protein ACOMHN_038681 [Nucella lapillus]